MRGFLSLSQISRGALASRFEKGVLRINARPLSLFEKVNKDISKMDTLPLAPGERSFLTAYSAYHPVIEAVDAKKVSGESLRSLSTKHLVGVWLLVGEMSVDEGKKLMSLVMEEVKRRCVDLQKLRESLKKENFQIVSKVQWEAVERGQVPPARHVVETEYTEAVRRVMPIIHAVEALTTSGDVILPYELEGEYKQSRLNRMTSKQNLISELNKYVTTLQMTSHELERMLVITAKREEFKAMHLTVLDMMSKRRDLVMDGRREGDTTYVETDPY